MGFIRITAYSRYANQTCLNTYVYATTEFFDVEGLNAFLDAWKLTVVDQVRFIQSNAVNYFLYRIEELDVEAGAYYQEGGNEQGAVSGESLPPFNSWTYRLNVATRLTRPGRKAFVGVAESSISGLGEPITGFLPTLNTAGLALIADVFQSGNLVASPVIATLGYLVPNGPLSVLKSQPIVNASPAIMSTQNSRKIERLF